MLKLSQRLKWSPRRKNSSIWWRQWTRPKNTNSSKLLPITNQKLSILRLKMKKRMLAQTKKNKDSSQTFSMFMMPLQVRKWTQALILLSWTTISINHLLRRKKCRSNKSSRIKRIQLLVMLRTISSKLLLRQRKLKMLRLSKMSQQRSKSMLRLMLQPTYLPISLPIKPQMWPKKPTSLSTILKMPQLLQVLTSLPIRQQMLLSIKLLTSRLTRPPMYQFL